MAYFSGATLVLGSVTLCKSTKEFYDIVIFDGEKGMYLEAVLNISFRQKRLEQKSLSIKTSRHNAPWTMQSPETKRTLQSHYPPGGEEKSVEDLPTQKKINMYIVGCFDSHFAIDSN